jgi:hypothetical protein
LDLLIQCVQELHDAQLIGVTESKVYFHEAHFSIPTTLDQYRTIGSWYSPRTPQLPEHCHAAGCGPGVAWNRGDIRSECGDVPKVARHPQRSSGGAYPRLP